MIPLYGGPPQDQSKSPNQQNIRCFPGYESSQFCQVSMVLVCSRSWWAVGAQVIQGDWLTGMMKGIHYFFKAQNISQLNQYKTKSSKSGAEKSIYHKKHTQQELCSQEPFWINSKLRSGSSFWNSRSFRRHKKKLVYTFGIGVRSDAFENIFLQHLSGLV